MFQKIMVPVDLRHLERIERALTAAGDLAGLYGCSVVYVGVTTETPSELGHTPADYAAKLQAFARQQAEARGIRDANAVSYASPDPAVDLDNRLLQVVSDTGADLVVIGSHKPGLAEYVFSSNAAYVAKHAQVSVMVVR